MCRRAFLRYDGPVEERRTRLAILGSTGSIGRQTLDVVSKYRREFEVVALSAGRNADLLAAQVVEVRPRFVDALERTPVLEDAVRSVGAVWLPAEEIAAHPDVDLVVVATVGAAGLLPTLAALRARKAVALANKEVLVMAGHLVRRELERSGGELRPIDSEHSAIWQSLWGEEGHAIRRIILTASGGAFRDRTLDELARVTPEEALDHPTWRMGPKITVDSATLMNKGMETIEAAWLFGVPMERVEVVIHRESVIHSLVEFSDGSVKAQLGVPDMRLPILCALAYPKRLPEPVAPLLDLAAYGQLTFGKPDFDRFPCLRLAMEAGRLGGTYPAVMAAADEVAVARFLAGELGFLDIPAVIERALERHEPIPDPSLEEVLAADAWARQVAGAVPAGAW
jgi:1-deoxy-D-xylulose-5-phosphate reductoisomerase